MSAAGYERGERDDTAAAAGGNEAGTGMLRGMERATGAGRVAWVVENWPSR